MKLVESVPNFSEGRREDVVREIIAEAEKYQGVWVLDWSMDPDHNRSVVTMIGKPEPLLKALF
ncbi:MAG: glutamate formiminotransferase, partial [Thermotogaceae bacterium]|nr:glutamate formiminotransferase [Thermotogaceae bacterium]